MAMLLQTIQHMSAPQVLQHKAHHRQFLNYTDWLDRDAFGCDECLAWAIYYYTLGDCDREASNVDVAVRALRWRQPPRPNGEWLFQIDGTWRTMDEARQWLVRLYLNHTDTWELQDGAMDDRSDLLRYA